MNDPDLSQYEKDLLANIAEYGCSVTSVFDPEGTEPSFSYSIGFTKTVDQPEVIAFGLNAETMHFMINETFRQCEEGLSLDEDTRIAGLLEGYDVIVRTVLPARIDSEYLNSAMWFHRREFGKELDRVVQLVWPSSTTGLFPWEPGCHESVIDAQPALYLPSPNS